jgi:hypothetical protein
LRPEKNPYQRCGGGGLSARVQVSHGLVYAFREGFRLLLGMEAQAVQVVPVGPLIERRRVLRSHYTRRLGGTWMEKKKTRTL